MPEIRRAAKLVLERDVVAEIRLALGCVPGLILWRNPVHNLESFDEERGKVIHLRAGLAEGSADLIGVFNGRFIALEVKKPKTGRASEKQVAWLASVRACGGFACFVRSIEESKAALERCALGEAQ
jgi:hypothetical protein